MQSWLFSFTRRGTPCSRFFHEARPINCRARGKYVQLSQRHIVLECTGQLVGGGRNAFAMLSKSRHPNGRSKARVTEALVAVGGWPFDVRCPAVRLAG